MLSMDHSFSFRNFDLSMQFHSWLDFDIYNANAMYNGIRTKTGTNVLRDWYYDHKEIKDGDHVLTDYFLEDGSFLKIDAITLGYTLPMKNGQMTTCSHSVLFHGTRCGMLDKI